VLLQKSFPTRLLMPLLSGVVVFAICSPGRAFSNQAESTLEVEKREIKLPAEVDQMEVCGRGNLLAMHFKSLKKIAIFDAIKAKFINEIPTSGSNIVYAGGADKLLIIDTDNKLVSRWDLETAKRELTKQIDIQVTPRLLFGSSATATAILIESSASDAKWHEIDVDTLNLREILLGQKDLQACDQWRISHEGNSFWCWNSKSRSPITMVVKFNGVSWEQSKQGENVTAVIPTTDGLTIVGGIGREASIGSIKLDVERRRQYMTTHPSFQAVVRLSSSNSRSRTAEMKESPTLQIEFNSAKARFPQIENLAPLFAKIDEGKRNTNPGFENVLLNQYASQRLIVNPLLGMVMQLSATNTELFLYQFDLKEILNKIERDYLLISSIPNTSATIGKPYLYAVETLTKDPNVKYRLESAPPSMSISENGRIKWLPNKNSAPRFPIVVCTETSSGQSVRQSFILNVSGSPESETHVVRFNDAASAEIKLSSDIKRSRQSPSRTIHLPYVAGNAVPAANGRFILIHFPAMKNIAVFDVAAARITHYLPCKHRNSKLVCGATVACVFYPDLGFFEKYRLDTFELASIGAIPFSGQIQQLLLGHNSNGPIFIQQKGRLQNQFKPYLGFIDIDAMLPIPIQWPYNSHQKLSHPSNHDAAVSADGFTFVIPDIGIVRFRGGKIDAESLLEPLKATDFCLPSASGRWILNGSEPIDLDHTPYYFKSSKDGVGVPTLNGEFFAKIDVQRKSNSMSRQIEHPIAIYQFGNEAPLAVITDVVRFHNRSAGWRFHPPKDRQVDLSGRLFVIPKMQAIVTLPPDRNMINFMEFDLEKSLADSRIKYVKSRPPEVAPEGKTLRYSPVLNSQSQNVTVELVMGPEGMNVIDHNTVVWEVPKFLPEKKYEVVIAVTDDGGQKAEQSFWLTIPEAITRTKHERNSQLEQIEKQRALKAEQQYEKDYWEKLVFSYEAQKAKQSKELTKKVDKLKGSIEFEPRTWADRTGKITLEATFVEIKDRKSVVLKLKNDETRAIDLFELSKRDIYEAASCQLRLEQAQPPSPFKK
jgi:hypothetical protein